VLMGRRTYEAGYAYGLKPGDKPYPHMDHYVISTSLQLPTRAGLHVVAKDPERVIRELRAAPGSDIYLCGGSDLAGWMLERELIDRVVIKLNPVLLGRGLSPFARRAPRARLQQTDLRSYANGVVLLRYDVAYG
jgi:dihydrofolate reductase